MKEAKPNGYILYDSVEKAKYIGIVKRYVISKGLGGTRDVLGQWNYSVWYYKGGYMPVCIY